MEKSIDPNIHVGEKHGRLTIISYAGKNKFGKFTYNCRCECGTEKAISYNALSTGHTSSCGCYNREQSSKDHNERIGSRYGRLVITGFDHRDGKRYYYKCHCDCGNDKVVRYDYLTSGDAVSCGCYNREIHSKSPDRHIGETWGRLTIIAFDHTDPYYNLFYKVHCQCGNEKIVTYSSLKHGKVVSCGCYSREVHTKHDMSHDRLFIIWRNMHERCSNEKDPAYAIYGARGIKVCDEWTGKFEGLYKFRDWALSHGYQDTLSIDRIDNDGNYEPSNCRWVDDITQANNKRNNVYVAYRLNKGSDPQFLVYTYAEWARITNYDYLRFRSRILNHGNQTINEVIEQCYSEGHLIPRDENFQMEISSEVLEANHINNINDAIKD